MSIKFRMTQEGMQSMYTMAWRQGVARPKVAQDPMFAGYGAVEAEESADADVAMLEEGIVAPGRVAPLEEVVRSKTLRDRLEARRALNLLWLGYMGF
jgi:hypothetical protein